MCDFCGDKEETILHVFRDCPKAMDIWGSMVPLSNRGDFFMSDLQDLISFNLNHGIQWHGAGAWCDIWAAVCHSLWNWKNKEDHA
jgi:hypothetical protein